MALFVFTACGIASLFTAQVGEPPYTTHKTGATRLSEANLADLMGLLTPQLVSNGGFQ